MNTREKIQELKFVIARFDHYYDSVNNKGNLYLAVNTFILGGVIGGYVALDNLHHFGNSVLTLLIAVLISNLLSVAYTLAAIKPFLKKKNRRHSMIYFGDVGATSEATINKYWNNLDEGEFKEDLLSQCKILAEGLHKKFIRLQKATWFVGVQIAGIILFGIILLIKH